MESTYEQLKNMTIEELLAAAASVNNDEVGFAVTQLVGNHWDEIDCVISRLADQIDAREIDLARESAYSGLEDCF